ncbi:glycerol-3-phosphate acyltransferase Sct1 [Mucor ambiguus]|uniref:Glycerol-3-phosphate acyltransferase Sct1 n=1 Tax=Mucor ambiguus TaxID=91626 RepID=A0A0C9M7Z7_9FUNG|nr:glycerol-3-phosphate acyltransferase Sct1 [Mucor ambiguus]
MSQPSTSITYLAFQGVFKAISHIFFREIKTTDVQNVPTSGPCIFIVGPHANQFVDGVVYMSVNPRPSYALMAAVSYDKPLIGHVGKILNAIPVVRPQDIVNVGTGKIRYDSVNQPLQLQGQGTKFTEEIGTRDFIVFGRNYKVHVSKVLSDTLLEITHSIQVDQQMVGDEYLAFKIAPHVDQTAVYDEVYNYLNRNECVTIFPEGGSHDRSEMLPLKAGFAVMALGAAAANPALDIKIVPVGLNYFHPDRFRSRAVVSFGQPMTIDKADVAKYKLGGKDKREAVTKLLDQSDEAFKTVTVNAPDYDTLMVVQAARRLYVPKSNAKPSIEQVVKLNRHFVSLWAKLKGDPSLEVIVKKVKYYNDMLTFFGIRDYQVDKLDITPVKAAYQLTKRITKLVAMAGLGAPALISNLPLIWITSYISKKKQKQALAGSSVKIAGKDVLATWKVIVAAFAAPALYGVYALFYLVYLLKRKPNLSLKAKLTRAGFIWAIQPILHYLLMRLGDTGLDIYKSIKPLFLAIRNPEAGEIIRSMRRDLSRDMTEFINLHAPELGIDGNSSSSNHSSANSVQASRSNSDTNLLDQRNSESSSTSFLEASISTTTDDMPESYLVSSRDESFLEYSSTEELNESKYHVESIILNDEEQDGEDEQASPLSQI